MPGIVLLALVGAWLAAQGTVGRLGARVLSWREIRPGEVPAIEPTGAPSGPAGDVAPVPGSAPTGLGWPLHGPVTGRFGEQRATHVHEGIDIAVPTGTPIGAAGAGTVTRAGWNNGYGNYISIDHGDGLTTAYGHLFAIAAGTRVGATVTRGQEIGQVGSTGDSTGPHLHFEVRRNGQAIDPAATIGGAP